MKCAGMNNQGYTNRHTQWSSGQIPRPWIEAPFWATSACSKRSRSWAEEEHYPLLAAEIRQAVLLSSPLATAVCYSTCRDGGEGQNGTKR